MKPENILLRNCGSKNLQIKLIDFGFAAYCQQSYVSTETDDSEMRQLDNAAHCKSTRLTEVLGSPLYMAPEIVKKQSYDHKVDVWSAGVVIYAMLSGRLPFFGNRKEQVYASICNDEVPLHSSCWQNKSEEVKDFIRLALIKTPALRPSSSELMGHPWLTKVHSTSKKLKVSKDHEVPHQI